MVDLVEGFLGLVVVMLYHCPKDLEMLFLDAVIRSKLTWW